MKKNEYESSQPDEQAPENDVVIYKPFTSGRQLSEEETEHLKQIAAMPDETINFDDIPELSADQWKTAVFNPYVPASRRTLRRAS